MLKRKIYLIFILLLLPGHLILFLSSTDAATYTYDSLLRITRADYINGFSEEYTYDSSGNRLTVTVTSKRISGNGYTYPEPGFSASLSLEVRASSLESGWFTYYYTKSGIDIESTLITGLEIDGTIAVITGECTANGLVGYSFRVTVINTDPDTVDIEIYNPDRTVYFSSDNGILASGDLSIETEPPDHYHLATSLFPSDSGSVSPDCSTGCLYENGTSLTITANGNIGYDFLEWNGCDSAANNICVLTMDSDRHVTAHFGSCGSPVRILGADPVYYFSIQDAYDESVNADIIQLQDVIFSEDIQIDRDVSITLQGGYDCTYYSNIGRTTLEGSMTISNGTVTIERLVIE